MRTISIIVSGSATDPLAGKCCAGSYSVREGYIKAMANDMEKKNILNRIIDGISGIFLPVVNVLSAAGILKGILVILTTTGVLGENGGTYMVLSAMSDALFYFLPLVLAYSSAEKFGANKYVAVVVAGVCMYPALNTILESGQTVYFLGIPLMGVTYHSSVLPVIMAVGLLYYVEKLLNRCIPEIIKGFMIPMISMVVVSFAMLLIFGPAGSIVGKGLAVGYEWLYGHSAILAGAVVGMLIQPMVIFGFHWSLFLVSMNNVAVKGRDTILALIVPAVFAQAGAALAVMVKSKDKSFRTTCASAALSAVLGITEPAMFGVNLPRKKPMAAVCIGGAVGGAIAGASGASAVSFVLPGAASMPVFIGAGFGMLIASCIIGMAAAFVLTLFMHREG